MISSSAQLNALLHGVWPDISRIEWSAYGEKIEPYDELGVPKYTGIITHYVVGERRLGCATQALGFLPRPEKSAQIVVKKVRQLEIHTSHVTSLESRNPDQGCWGGAVRAFAGFAKYGISGLPEIGDHLLAIEMMHRVGQLDTETYMHFVDPHTSAIKKACEHVGMTTGDFSSLQTKIKTIVCAAAKRL